MGPSFVSCLAIVVAGLAVLQVGESVPGVPEIGGTFRYGHIYWTSVGNEVHYRVEVVFKRNIPQVSYWKGTFSDELAQVGDELTLLGRETPQMYLGDGTIEQVIRMRVVAFSVEEDWVMGEFQLKHKYATPNNAGLPWLAELSGCCRLSVLTNNKDSEWVVTAAVDLTVANQSPRARNLPVVSVPIDPQTSPAPWLYVPVDYHTPAEVGYKIAEPWAVGNSVQFTGSSGSFLSVPLNQLWNGATSCTFESVSATPERNGPDCLFELLRARKVQTSADVIAMTVEGWVKINADSGGTVLNVGEDGFRTITLDDVNPDYPIDAVCGSPSLNSNNAINSARCLTSSLFIKVSKTHITVGHEVAADTVPYITPHQIQFDVCSSPVTVLDSNLCTGGVGDLTGKWVHVAVVRYGYRHGLDQTNLVSYKVYLMGEVLETETFKVRDRPSGMSATDGKYELGESDVLPSPNPVSAGDIGNNFMQGAAITFGAYIGSDQNDYLNGYLDEWRFWSGARTQSGILQYMNQPIKPENEQFNGDPSAERPISAHNQYYRVNSILLASYSFDAQCLATDPQCAVTMSNSSYPKTDKPKFVAYAGSTNMVTAAPTDSTGVMFYSDGGGMSITSAGQLTLLNPSVGTHQVSVHVTFGDGNVFVPVDFLVEVLPARCTANDFEECNLECEEEPCSFTNNQMSPNFKVYAPVAQAGAQTPTQSVYVGSDLMDSVDAELFLYPGMIEIFTGFEVNVTLEGSDSQTEGGIMDAIYTNVGFSSGTAPSQVKFTNVRGTNPGMMDVLWMPCAESVGLQTICFDAVDRHIKFNPQPQSAASIQKCLRFTISDDSAPVFLTGVDQTPNSVVELTMGQHASLTLMAVEQNCLDTVSIAFENASHAPAGAFLGEQTLETVTGQQCPAAKRLLMWTPSYNHGGFNRMLCFAASDMGGTCDDSVRHVSTHCIHVMVHRCRYALLMDQQLQEIADRFGTTWMNLWSLNADLQHPDYIVYGGSGQTIMIGHDYSALQGESPAAIAKRMGMHIDHLAFLNFGLDVMGVLSAGQSLCVIPNSCEGMSVTGYDQQFADASFFQESSGSDGTDRT